MGPSRPSARLTLRAIEEERELLQPDMTHQSVSLDLLALDLSEPTIPPLQMLADVMPQLPLSHQRRPRPPSAKPRGCSRGSVGIAAEWPHLCNATTCSDCDTRRHDSEDVCSSNWRMAWTSRRATMHAVLSDVVDVGKIISFSETPLSIGAKLSRARASKHRGVSLMSPRFTRGEENVKWPLLGGRQITKSNWRERGKHSRNVKQVLEREKRIARGRALANSAWEAGFSLAFRSFTLQSGHETEASIIMD